MPAYAMSLENLSEQEQVRRSKLQKLRDAGVQAYPERFNVSHPLKEASKLPDGTAGVAVAGRVMAVRKMGKLSFITIADIEGRIQLCVKQDGVGEKAYELFHSTVDIGDFV